MDPPVGLAKPLENRAAPPSLVVCGASDLSEGRYETVPQGLTSADVPPGWRE